MKRLLAVAIVAFTLAPTGSASAHGGADTVYEGTVGPYFVVAEASLQGGDTPATADALDYSLYLRDADSQRAIPSAETTVRMTAETSDGTIDAVSMSRFENVTSAHFPLASLVTWTMRIEIDGVRGDAEFTHPIELSQGSGVSWGVVGYLGGILTLILVGLAFGWRLMRQDRRPSTHAVVGGAVLAVGLMGLVAGCGDDSASRHATDGVAASDARSYAGTELQGPAPDFTLSDQSGETLSMSEFEGDLVVLTFLDPNCTDICPLTTLHFAQTQGKLDKRLAGRVVYLAINVNAEFNAVERVAEATRQWPSPDLDRWHFLTGNPDELRQVWEDYGVVVQPNPDKADQVTHTPGVYLIGPDGQRRWYVSTPLSSAKWETLDLPLAELLAERIREIAAD